MRRVAFVAVCLVCLGCSSHPVPVEFPDLSYATVHGPGSAPVMVELCQSGEGRRLKRIRVNSGTKVAVVYGISDRPKNVNVITVMLMEGENSGLPVYVPRDNLRPAPPPATDSGTSATSRIASPPPRD
jgi:hypothetical protein